MIRLCCNIFDPVWRKGLEEAIRNIDDKFRIPLLEKYMSLPPGSLELEVAYRWPSLLISENLAFLKEWPRMEANIQFLLQWRGIIEDYSKDWLRNYLNISNAYIQPGVSLDNSEALNFCTPNTEKSSREKKEFELPPFFQPKKYNDISEIIMVFWK